MIKKIIFYLIVFYSSFNYATNINKIIVFGDSLSDNGNFYKYTQQQFPQSPPYYKGRFSNGPIWIDILSEDFYKDNYKQHVFDYAYGGAGVLDDEDDEGMLTFHQEINTYLIGNDVQADNLYVIWIGANNYIESEEEDFAKNTNVVMRGISKAITRLVGKGAKHFLVIDLPDLGESPAARLLQMQEILSATSMSHNKALKETVATLNNKYPETNIIIFDIAQEFQSLLDNASTLGFTNTTDSCLDLDNSAKSRRTLMFAQKAPESLDCSGYLFFDSVHPTTAAHQIFARAIKNLLLEAGYTFYS